MTPEGAQDDAEALSDAELDSMDSAPVRGWDVQVVTAPHMPSRFIAVDKSIQKLYLYEHHSPLKVRQSFVCTTGQRSGDKQLSGDRRTPEGVYFVVSKIDNGLDFQEYGGIAHTLNYPNPVDRLRGKTGYGIWIHSKGRPISPQETKGCIALNLNDIATLGSFLPVGTPVIVAQQLLATPDKMPSGGLEEARQAIISILERKTRAWNASWAARSKQFFSYYWPEAYTKGQGETFHAFRAQKERLFKSLPWIQIIHGDIQVLQGPDYWVTWFSQYYRAPNLSTEGIRRLYWQADASGELRIVGMEWVPHTMGLETAYLETITPDITAFIEDWRKVWASGDVDAYMKFYAAQARQGERTGIASIRQQKERTWAKKPPANVVLSGLRVMVLQQGVKVDMTQMYTDATGYRDKGIKTLLLQPQQGTWRIVTEDWGALP